MGFSAAVNQHQHRPTGLVSPEPMANVTAEPLGGETRYHHK